MENSCFNHKIIELIETIEKEEADHIKAAAEIVYATMKNDGLLHVFCTGHSHMMAEELFYRAGGLLQVNPILIPILMQHEGAVRSTKFERLPGIAKILFDSENIKKGEPFLISSNSGINVVPIEMAQCVKENGGKVIVVTSKKNNEHLTSRCASGLKLSDVADVVIDNHTPDGDGAIDSNYGKIGATSTIACSYIAQRLVLDIINCYEKDGVAPSIYMSANSVGGDEHNKEFIKKYSGRIRSLY
ncbi:MAG: SIS domain-containing protein [Clostridia bacterium]